MFNIPTAIGLELIARYGIPAAYQIVQIVKNKAEMTEAEWDALLVLSEKTGEQYDKEAILKLVAQPAILPQPQPQS